MCTQDRLVKLSSEVQRLGLKWALNVPTDETVADSDGWAISLRGLAGQPAHVKVVEVVSDSLDGALDMAIDVLGGAS